MRAAGCCCVCGGTCGGGLWGFGAGGFAAATGVGATLIFRVKTRFLSGFSANLCAYSVSLIDMVLHVVRRFLPAFLSLFLVVPSVAHAQRLPEGVHPEHYSLTLTPDLKAATFSGEETIDVVVDRPSSSITLNAAEI